MPTSADDEHATVPEADAAAALEASALDDYLAGFTAEPPAATSADTGAPDDGAGIMDTILLLRQAVKPAHAAPDAIAVPESIGRHAILRLAGEGGFAIVWEGFDTLLRRPVALKVRRPELLLSADARRRFVREAEIAARLVHPHIVTIYEVGEDAGREFIAAEYCSGGSLAAWLDRHPGPLAPRVAARLVRAVAAAVAFAHDAGVVHRDIKPANVLLHPPPPDTEPLLPSAYGGDRGLTVKLGDFGLGKLHEELDGSDPLTQLTRTNARIGTPAWMAPEQADRSLGPTGPATDIHALGLLLDRLLTGRPLRGGGTDTEIYRQVLLDEPVPADRVVRGVPRDLAAVAAKCLARHPTDRYATAGDVAADLDRWLAGRPTVARPLSPLGRAARLVRRRPVVAALAAVALTAVGAATWVGVDRSLAVASREWELHRQRGLEELRRGFEAMRAGNVAAALQQLQATRAIDPGLAESLAGRWLVRRTHGEMEILLEPKAGESGDAKQPRVLYAIALAPDGVTAAVAGADGSIHLLRGLDGTPTVITTAAHDEVNEVAFSSDGSLLASAGQDGRLRWWRLTADGLVAAGEARPGTGPLYAAAWSLDGRTIAIGGEDRVVRLVSSDAPGRTRELFRFDLHPENSPDVESLAFVDAATLAAVCGNTVVLLDIASGRVVQECERPTQTSPKIVYGSLTVSADRSRIMGCGTDAKAHVWDVRSGKHVFASAAHPAWVQGCAFSPDGARIATACRDGGVRVYAVASGELLNRMIGHVGRVWAVAYEPAGTLLTAGADGSVRRYDPRVSVEAAMFRELVAPADLISVVAERPRAGSAPVVLVIGRQGHVFEVDLLTGAAQPTGIDRTGRVRHVAFAPRSARLAISWQQDRPVEVLSLASVEYGARAAVPLTDGAAATQAIVSWTPTEDLVFAPRDGGLFWCPNGHQPVRRIASLEGVVNALAVAPTGDPRVAAAGDRMVIHTLPRSDADRSQPPPVVLPIGEQATAAAWSPDSRLLACGARSGAVHVFDAATGTSRGLLAPHERAIKNIAFTADGRGLVTADSSCVRISDVATLATLDEVRPGWSIEAMLLTADGERIVIGGPGAGDPTGSTRRLAVFDVPRP